MRTPHKLSGAALLAFLAAAPPLFSETWTDRGEYDLALLVRSEAAPEKRLALLDQWKAKYPGTAQQQVRRELYLSAYQSMGAWPRMLEVSREMVAAQPDNLLGLYWFTLLAPEANQPSPAFLDQAGKAARQLLDKAAAAPDPEWQKRRAAIQRLGTRTLVWVACARGAYDEAERQLAAWLRANPRDAEMSAWLAAIVAKHSDKQVTALWHLARAAAPPAKGAAGPDRSREFAAELERIYTAYHGGTDGLESLRAAAAAGDPMPPEGFQIESAAAAAVRRQDEELTRTHPELAAWLRIRRSLESPGWEKYLNETLRRAPLPKLRGTVVRATPARKPQEIVLSMAGGTGEELLLKVDEPFGSAAPAGAELEFEGASVEEFTREPFRLTVNMVRDRVQGWPAARAREE
ncbi:MAG: hypothetical protein ACE15B_02120 [Bryobacteraceae bacterium]